jgi:hypothetical protein
LSSVAVGSGTKFFVVQEATREKTKCQASELAEIRHVAEKQTDRESRWTPWAAMVRARKAVPRHQLGDILWIAGA